MIDFCEKCDAGSKEKCRQLKKPEDIMAQIQDKNKVEKGNSRGLSELLNADDLVIYACWMGKHLSSREVNLKTAQIRKFYDALMGIKDLAGRQASQDSFDRFRPSITMLKPQLAFATAKQNRQMMPFYMVINPCLGLVNEYEDLTRLAQFMEAIVAYHKFHGGKD